MGKIRHGIPQGSILGQLLFLLYINDLARTINDKNKPRLSADNTSILVYVSAIYCILFPFINALLLLLLYYLFN